MIHIGPNGEGLDAITDPRDDVQVDPAAPAHVHASVQARVQRARDSFAWAQARADMAARNLAENLRTGFAGKTVAGLGGGTDDRYDHVIAAGPSLTIRDVVSDNSCDDRFWLAGTVAAKHGVGDLFRDRRAAAVIAECLPAPYLDRIPETMPIMCSITADPAVFARAKFVYVRADASYSRIARELKATQIADGVNVATTMLALTEISGACEVQLHGVDLCTSPGGAVYAGGTPWASARVTATDGLMHYSDVPEQHPGFASAPAIQATNVRGEPVLTTPEWLEAKAWIERFSRRCWMEITNESGGLVLDLDKPSGDPSVPEPEWPTWTDDLALDLRIARDFEHRYPEVALFAANLRTRQPRTGNAIESLKDTMAIYQDAITRMRRGWEE